MLALLLGSMVAALGSRARALDDTDPLVRWGVSAGVLGTLAVGEDVAQRGAGDEFVPALWVDFEVLQFDLGARWSIVPFARFRVLGGVDADTIEGALEPSWRENAAGEPFRAPDPTLLQLGGRARFYPWARALGVMRPFVSLGAAYATAGARYEARNPAPSAMGTSSAGASTSLRRHRGVAALVGLGVRLDVPIRVFGSELLAPVAIEAQYIKNVWLDIEQNRAAERAPEMLAPRDMSLDFVGVSMTIGFLR